MTHVMPVLRNADNDQPEEQVDDNEHHFMLHTNVKCFVYESAVLLPDDDTDQNPQSTIARQALRRVYLTSRLCHSLE
jgi:hypothetical protein